MFFCIKIAVNLTSEYNGLRTVYNLLMSVRLVNTAQLLLKYADTQITVTF